MNFFEGRFTIGKLHPNVRVRHVDILGKRLPPSYLYCLSKDDELEMDNTIKRMKRGKKRGKTVKVKTNPFLFQGKGVFAGDF